MAGEVAGAICLIVAIFPIGQARLAWELAEAFPLAHVTGLEGARVARGMARGMRRVEIQYPFQLIYSVAGGMGVARGERGVGRGLSWQS